MWASAVLTLVLGTISAYTAVLLVQCEQELSARQAGGGKLPKAKVKRRNPEDTEDPSADLLSAAEQEEASREFLMDRPTLSFAEVAAGAFPSLVIQMGKEKWNIPELFVNSFVFLGTVGVSAAFYIFVITTIGEVSYQYAHGDGFEYI